MFIELTIWGFDEQRGDVIAYSIPLHNLEKKVMSKGPIYTVEYLDSDDHRLSPYQKCSVQRGNHWWIIIDNTKPWIGYPRADKAEGLATTMNHGRGFHEYIHKATSI